MRRYSFLAAMLSLLGLHAGAYAATLTSGFSERLIATGFTNPTAMAFQSDHLLFVAEQGGALRVIVDDTLLPQPFVTLSVDSTGERGLLGVAFDPNFASNNYVYVYYTTSTAPIHNRVSRFTASAANVNVAAAGSEVQLLNLPALSSATNHNGGAIHFGSDGKLYIAVGDNANSANAQSLASTFGKILRIDADGAIPTDNPFFSQTTGINRAIYARGLRNPFNFAVDPTNGRVHVNDVGQDAWEEVNHLIAGANFGWPQTEGPSPAGVAGVRYPIHAYGNAGSNCAIAGAVFWHPISGYFPPDYVGRYFFGDYCGGFIRMLDPPNYTTVREFATGIDSLVDIQVNMSGSLYYLTRGTGELFRVNYTDNTPPHIVSHPQNLTVAEGQPATFSVTATGAWPLRYTWYRNGSRIQGATSSSYGIVATKADNGATFNVAVSNPFGVEPSNTVRLTVLNTFTPTGTITTPVNGTGYRAGQTITFAGTGTDPNDGTLPPSAFTWRVDFYLNGAAQAFVPPTSGITTGTFTVPSRIDPSINQFFRVTLTVTDSSGATHTSFTDIRPQVSYIRIYSNVPGAQLTLDGAPITAPYEFVGIEGLIRSIGVVTPQTVGGIAYNFTSWSDGGQPTHEITTPVDDTTYTVVLRSAAATNLFDDNFETNRGWALVPGSNTAPRGLWQRGNPQATVFNGLTLQLENCDGNSVKCFITGLAAGNAVGSADVDEGKTSVQSPAITLPASGIINLRFSYFFAHNNNATFEDYFRVCVVRADGSAQTVFNVEGRNGSIIGGAWTPQTVNLSSFAGQTVRLRFEAADAAAGSIIEAGFDNASVRRE